MQLRRHDILCYFLHPPRANRVASPFGLVIATDTLEVWSDESPLHSATASTPCIVTTLVLPPVFCCCYWRQDLGFGRAKAYG